VDCLGVTQDALDSLFSFVLLQVTFLSSVSVGLPRTYPFMVFLRQSTQALAAYRHLQRVAKA